MFPRALRVARLGGIDLRVDPSWLIVAGLMVWSFTTRFAGPGRDGLTTLSMGGLAAIGFFMSILAHELAHAWEARHRDLEVSGITLFLFGGVTEMTGDAQSPRHEFAVAAVGPWISLVLAAAFGLITAGLDEYAAWGTDLALITGNLGWINLGVALFNLIPGAPLDGGRVLQAVLWRITGDRFRAGRIASYSGQVVALGLVGLAVATVANQRSNWTSAVWLGFVAAFMWFAASAERGQLRVLAVVHHRLARDLFPAAVDPLTPDVLMTALGPTAVARPVHGGGDAPRIVGVVTTRDLRDAHTATSTTAVADIMTSVHGLPTVADDAPLIELLQALHDHPIVSVTRDDEVVTVVDRATANHLLDLLRRGDMVVAEGLA